jgi:hypothetical protein
MIASSSVPGLQLLAGSPPPRCAYWPLRGEAWLARLLVVGVAPNTYLRLMAEELQAVEPPKRQRVLAVSIQAVAHAFMMLGLIRTEGAEPAITQANLALERAR